MSDHSKLDSPTNTIAKPFTQSWIQALTLAADSPVARKIKPKLEWLDRISMHRAGTERLEAAQELWDYAVEEGLTEVLKILPVGQSRWEFPEDERFLYERREPPAITDFSVWCQHLGIQPHAVKFQSEVTSSDWTGLVRSEAVRLQKPFNSSAFTETNTVRPPCTAMWDGESWSVRFDQIDWLVLRYEDLPRVRRPSLEEIEDSLLFAVAEADATKQPKSAIDGTQDSAESLWVECVPTLAPLHKSVLQRTADYSPWLRRTWSCVWPVVYREQNLLRGQADLEWLRPEVAACIATAPRLTVWMFIFAKLACQIQSGMGLGICADYVD